MPLGVLKFTEENLFKQFHSDAGAKIVAAQKKNEKDFNYIIEATEISISSYIPLSIAEAFEAGAAINMSDVTSAFSHGRKSVADFGRGAIGYFLEDAFFGSNAASSPFADEPFSLMQRDIEERMHKCANDPIERARLQKLKENLAQISRNDYYKTMAEVFGNFPAGEEIKSKKGNTREIYKNILHIGDTTIEQGEDILFAAIKKLYTKMGTLLLLSIRYEDVSNRKYKDNVFLLAVDIFHELMFDRAIIAFATNLITVTGTQEYEKPVAGSLINKERYSLQFDFSKLDNFLASMAEKLLGDFSSTTLVADKLRASHIYAYDERLFPKSGNQRSLFGNVIEYLKSSGMTNANVRSSSRRRS